MSAAAAEMSIDLSPASPGRLSRSARLSRGAGLVVMLAAILVLVGWAFDIRWLTQPMAAKTAMNPMSAVCLLLAGLALWVLAPPPSSTDANWRANPRTRAIGIACAVVVLVVVVPRFLAYVIGFGWDIDRVLFSDKLAENRMAPNTALALSLHAAALLIIAADHKSRHRIAPLLAIGGGLLGLLALLGYVYGIDHLRQVWTFIPMAVHTAVLLLIQSVGILAARPDREPVATILSDSAGGVLSRRLFPAAVVIPIVAGYLRLHGEKAGLYNTATGVSLYTLTTILVFVVLIWWNARFLHRLDAERRRGQEKLRQAEAVYESLVETLPQNIFRKDLQGRFTFGNNNFAKELGRPVNEIVGKTDFDFFTESLARRYRSDDQAIVDTGMTFDKVEEHVTPDGQRLFVQVIKTPVRDKNGTVLGVQGIFWDVTDRVTQEEALERNNQALAETNQMLSDSVRAERRALETSRQANDALREAQSRMVQSEKLVGLGQMVAGVAHEINNPLAFVTNNVAVLERDLSAVLGLLRLYQQADAELKAHRPVLADQIRDRADQIDLGYTLDNLNDLVTRSKEGLRRIQQIVRDLRDFARLDESERQDADLNSGIESTVNIILGHAKKKQVTLVKQLGKLPRVTCFPAKINQVVMNLLSNAIDASHEEGTVTIRTRACDGVSSAMRGTHHPAGPVVEIEVSDQGTGIPPAILGRIFDPFFTTKPQGQGTGLGLSISYGIVRDHGGVIDVQSTPGVGTTFRVILPVHGGHAPDEAGQTSTPSPAETPATDGEGI